MSNKPEIPERWKRAYGVWKMHHVPGAESDYSMQMALAEEVGEAESRVRELEQALRTIREDCFNDSDWAKVIDAALHVADKAAQK